MDVKKIPGSTVRRLSLYLRELNDLEHSGKDFISSTELGKILGVTDAQIRRDLSYFGQFGVSGKGYRISELKGSIKHILGIDGREWHLALVGTGNLGSALLAYKGFKEQGFIVKAAFDNDAAKVGRTIGGVKVDSISNIEGACKKHNVRIGIIAVPESSAQEVADKLIGGGVKTLVNFSPARIKVPKDIKRRNVDLSVELESLSYFLTSST